jgi:hypothetical protein
MAMNLIQARLFFKTKLMAATGGRGPLFGQRRLFRDRCVYKLFINTLL